MHLNCFDASPRCHTFSTVCQYLPSKILLGFPIYNFEMGDAILKAKEAHGRRLMTSIIDDRACSNPKKTFMSIPAGDKVTDGQRDISYGEFARAINRCAWWIVDTLGKGVDFPSIATYMYPMDFRHVILTFGSIKAGYQVLHELARITP